MPKFIICWTSLEKWVLFISLWLKEKIMLGNMNNRLANYIFFCFIIFFLSCDKKADPPLEESPFFNFLDFPSIHIDTSTTANDSWEYGFVFKPLKKGEIRKLGLKLPVQGEFTVRLWNFDPPIPIIIHERKIRVNQNHFPEFVNIPFFKTEATKMGISVISNNFYRVQKKDSTAFTFPINVGNISILSFNESQIISGVSDFPNNTNQLRVAPCVNVVFVAE
ncbi:MAG: hypothetical protein IPO62_16020 [Saprospiraceae bacterium]|nr:hypothetical protein [Saprospiraceae bacterium]